MKVYNSVITNQYQYKPSFRSNNNEWRIFGIDEGGQAIRDYIRKWRDEHYFPYQSIYENEHQLSDFELHQLISDLVREPIEVNNNLINELHIKNLKFVNDNSYRGAMIDYKELDKVGMLYKAGIRRIIVVGRGYNALKDECEKIGMEYQAIEFDDDISAYTSIYDVETASRKDARDILKYNDEQKIEEYVNHSISNWKENTRTFIDEFTSYIQKMKKGNVFIGCNLGTYSTDTAILLNYLFNPEISYNNGLREFNKIFVGNAEDLYHNLTESDKLSMGWPKGFEKTFFKRLGKLKKIVRKKYM